MLCLLVSAFSFCFCGVLPAGAAPKGKAAAALQGDDNSVEAQAAAAHLAYRDRMYEVADLMKKLKKPEDLNKIMKRIELLLGHTVPDGATCPYPQDPEVQLEFIKRIDKYENAWFQRVKRECRRISKQAAKAYKANDINKYIQVQLTAQNLLNDCHQLPFIRELYRRDANHPVLKQWYKDKPLFKGY